MKLIFMIPIVIGALVVYFALSLFILPDQYLAKNQLVSQPTLDILVSDYEITLGESFEVKLTSKNVGDVADVLVASIAFPELEQLDDKIKIVSYDFIQSPVHINVGDEIGAEYLSIQKTIPAEYPSIEAYTRPSRPGTEYHMTLEILPIKSGKFVFYTKAVTLPHLTDISHVPQEGKIDHQGEFVEVYTVIVKP